MKHIYSVHLRPLYKKKEVELKGNESKGKGQNYRRIGVKDIVTVITNSRVGWLVGERYTVKDLSYGVRDSIITFL